MSDSMTIHLRVWRQAGPESKGKFVNYTVADVNSHMSFLELLDVLNEQLIHAGDDPVEFDHDCREGICGACGVVIDGVAHGPQQRTAACQLHMRHYQDGDMLVLEPWRATAFPIIRDLVADRSALDRIVAAGGYVSVDTGSAPDANSILISKNELEGAFDFAACIGCGACVAACPNASASLFTGAKIAHLSGLPQGRPERKERAVAMVEQMQKEGFGDCSNHGECEAVCPKGISIAAIAIMRREYMKAKLA